ncbi:MAG: hypothetical protein WCY19_06295, partial [Candidatus Gastranaerophilaceae bacterium]
MSLFTPSLNFWHSLPRTEIHPSPQRGREGERLLLKSFSLAYFLLTCYSTVPRYLFKNLRSIIELNHLITQSLNHFFKSHSPLNPFNQNAKPPTLHLLTISPVPAAML